MISTSAQYAVRATMHVARNGGWHTSDAIALATAIPSGYLAKIMNLLTRAGILVSQRGANGGFRLHRPAEGLSVLEIVRAVDQAGELGSCRDCHAPGMGGACAANRFFAQVEADLEERMRGMSLAILLSGCAPGDLRS